MQTMHCCHGNKNEEASLTLMQKISKILSVRKARYRIPCVLKKKKRVAGHWWLTPVILAIQEGKIRRIEVQCQPGQIICETLSQKTLHKKKG
jgi:hypothetical protein